MKTIVKIYIWIRTLRRASKINEEIRAYRSHPSLSVTELFHLLWLGSTWMLSTKLELQNVADL